MLAQVCEYIHNYFLKKENGRVVYYHQQFAIEGGMISLPFLKEGQRFLLSGSDLNDGIYTYHADGITNDDDNAPANLADEAFTGEICPMAVRPDFLLLVQSISDWMTANEKALTTPFASESFNGYSYTLKGSLSGETAANDPPWASQFAAQLSPWRKIAR